MAQPESTERPRTQAERELLDDIASRARLPPNVTPEGALSAVMCALSQHLTGGEARDVFVALPPPIKPLLEPCMIHRGEPAQRFGRDAFLRRVAEHLKIFPEEAEDVAAAVLGAVSARLPVTEVAHAMSQLPRDLRGLWVPRRAVPPVEPHPILEQIERSVDLPPGVTGLGAFVAVMGLLTKRLTRGETRHLVDNLPPDLRPLLEDCLLHRGEEPERFHRAELLARIAARLKTTTHAADEIARAVFRAVKEYLLTDVIEHVASQLPADIQDLWVLA